MVATAAKRHSLPWTSACAQLEGSPPAWSLINGNMVAANKSHLPSSQTSKQSRANNKHMPSLKQCIWETPKLIQSTSLSTKYDHFMLHVYLVVSPNLVLRNSMDLATIDHLDTELEFSNGNERLRERDRSGQYKFPHVIRPTYARDQLQITLSSISCMCSEGMNRLIVEGNIDLLWY